MMKIRQDNFIGDDTFMSHNMHIGMYVTPHWNDRFAISVSGTPCGDPNYYDYCSEDAPGYPPLPESEPTPPIIP